MVERTKTLAWKASMRVKKRIVGSNPTLSAKETLNFGYNFAVLDGEVAVPCNLQPAIAGLNSIWRLLLCGAARSKWC